jgi:predicted RNA-binding Zn-ribbon protein involved in translation (DUF1610 family)
MKGILWAVLRSPVAVLPIFDQGQPHHITLFYDVDKKGFEALIGTEFEATAIANIHNKDIQAIAVLMPPDIPHKPNPHITISFREGIAPVASNELMVNDCDRVIMPFNQKLTFKIEFFEFPECHHHWRKNGTRNSLQTYSCKHCGKSKTEGDRAKGRQK